MVRREDPPDTSWMQDREVRYDWTGIPLVLALMASAVLVGTVIGWLLT